jgi:tRNA nucleotidyltransferase (CCA-adding enzyme)
MEEFGLLHFLHSRLAYDAHTKTLLTRVYEVVKWFDLLFLEGTYSKWMVYFLGLADQLQPKELEELASRLSLAPRNKKRLLEARVEGTKVLQRARRKRLSPPKIYTLFKPLPVEALLYIMAKTDDTRVKKAISLFFTKLKDTTVSVQGKDLKGLGIQPGPLYREIIDSLLLARLKGTVKTKADEIRYIRTHYLAS